VLRKEKEMAERELQNLKKEKQQTEQRLRDDYEKNLEEVKKQSEIEKQQADRIFQIEKEKHEIEMSTVKLAHEQSIKEKKEESYSSQQIPIENNKQGSSFWGIRHDDRTGQDVRNLKHRQVYTQKEWLNEDIAEEYLSGPDKNYSPSKGKNFLNHLKK